MPEQDLQQKVEYVAKLPFGEGLIGKSHALGSEQEFEQFGDDLSTFTTTLTKSNTADCVDERRTLGFVDGNNNPDIIKSRVVPQLPGGLGLAVTKAVVAADARIVKDARDFKQAYLTIVDVLANMNYEDGGHKGCGASKSVEASAAHGLSAEVLLPVAGLLTRSSVLSEQAFAKNLTTIDHRLHDGFYGNWDNSWHESFLSERFPQNFAVLADDPEDQETFGHHGSAAYGIFDAGLGFEKNNFIERTGQEAFAYSAGFADKLAKQLGLDEMEQARIAYGFAMDAPLVLNKLVIKDFPVFAA